MGGVICGNIVTAGRSQPLCAAAFRSTRNTNLQCAARGILIHKNNNKIVSQKISINSTSNKLLALFVACWSEKNPKLLCTLVTLVYSGGILIFKNNNKIVLQKIGIYSTSSKLLCTLVTSVYSAMGHQCFLHTASLSEQQTWKP